MIPHKSEEGNNCRSINNNVNNLTEREEYDAYNGGRGRGVIDFFDVVLFLFSFSVDFGARRKKKEAHV